MLMELASFTPSRISSENWPTPSTLLDTAVTISWTTFSISKVAKAVWSARRRISLAMTPKLPPFSPSLCASIAALRERRFVRSATLVMVVITPVITPVFSLRVESFSAIEVEASTICFMMVLSLDSPSFPDAAMEEVSSAPLVTSWI